MEKENVVQVFGGVTFEEKVRFKCKTMKEAQEELSRSSNSSGIAVLRLEFVQPSPAENGNTLKRHYQSTKGTQISTINHSVEIQGNFRVDQKHWDKFEESVRGSRQKDLIPDALKKRLGPSKRKIKINMPAGCK